MKKITILIFIMISSLCYSQSAKSKNKETAKAAEPAASTFIILYSQHDGSPGNPIENWYAKNTSTNKAIKFTVLFWTGQIEFGNKATEVFELEPGEIKSIRTKTSGGQTWNAQLQGARFL
jgi:hypothetical protein